MKNFKKNQIDKKELQSVKGGRWGDPISRKECEKIGWWDERRNFCVIF